MNRTKFLTSFCKPDLWVLDCGFNENELHKEFLKTQAKICGLDLENTNYKGNTHTQDRRYSANAVF